MNSIVALLADAEAQATLITAGVRTGYCGPRDLAFVGCWRELIRFTCETRPNLAVIDPDVGRERAGIERFRTFVRQFPSTPAVAYTRFGRRSAVDAARLGREGVWIADRDSGGDGDLSRLLRNPPRARMVEDILERLTCHVPAPMLAVFGHTIIHAETRYRPSDLADAFYCHPSTLGRELKAAGLPSPNRLIVWGRLIAAAVFLERGERVGAIADRYGYRSTAAFRNQFVRYVGTPPRKVKRIGALGVTIEAMVASFIPGPGRPAGRPRAALSPGFYLT